MYLKCSGTLITTFKDRKDTSCATSLSTFLGLTGTVSAATTGVSFPICKCWCSSLKPEEVRNNRFQRKKPLTHGPHLYFHFVKLRNSVAFFVPMALTFPCCTHLSPFPLSVTRSIQTGRHQGLISLCA